MLLISNRGNTNGPSEYANRPDYLRNTIAQGFMVKTDLWVFPRTFMTGILDPVYIIDMELLQSCIIECRNLQAFEFILRTGLHGFYKQSSDLVFTNKGMLLTFGPWIKQSVIMNPDDHSFESILKSSGVCSNFIKGFIDENSYIG